MNLLIKYLVHCFVWCYLLGGCENAFAQSSSCPSDYFELRTTSREYFSFRVEYENVVLFACGTVNDLMFYHKKYKNPERGPYNKNDVASFLKKGFVLKSAVPFDSLYFFDFASSAEIREVDAVALKGEKYFLNHYFGKKTYLRLDRKMANAALVKHLQNWCIVARQDDESGYLAISYKFVWPER